MSPNPWRVQALANNYQSGPGLPEGTAVAETESRRQKWKAVAIWSALYMGVCFIWIAGVPEDLLGLALAIYLVSNLAFGVVIGKWAATLLAAWLVLLSLPIATVSFVEDTTVFDLALLAAFVAAALIAFGVVARKIYDTQTNA